MTHDNDRGSLIQAMVRVQAELKPAIKNKANPFFKSSYADLSEVWNVCREPLTKNNLAVFQTTDVLDGKNVLITTLAHTSGQTITSRLLILPVKDDPASLGAALTYTRRFALAAIIGIVTEDDTDGQPPTTSKTAPQKVGGSEINHTCNFGKNNGVKWVDMTAESLNFYKGHYEKCLEDPKKDKFHPDAKAGLKGIYEAMILRQGEQENTEAPGA